MVAYLDPRRLGRGVSLVVAGAVLGALLVGPVSARVIAEAPNAVPAASLQTRSASCPSYGFVPADSSTAFDTQGTLRRADGFVICEPTLPSGAVVTKVQFTLEDNNSGGISLCGLVRLNLAASSAGENKRLHWTVFRPSRHRETSEWTLWAFDPNEHVPPGAKRSRERLVRAPAEFGEVAVVREMARALEHLSAR